MAALFGIPTSQLARALSLLTAMLLLGMVLLAMRRRTLFRIGVRNVLRRPQRSAVIVVGLMLSTVVVATAFSTGDAMTLTVRSLVTGSVGQVDEVITNSQSDFTQLSSRDLGTLASGGGLPAASTRYFPESEYQMLRDGVRQSRAIAGLMPVVLEQAAAADGEAQLAHPNVGLLGVPAGEVPGFGNPHDERGQPQPIAALADGELYVNRAAADLLSAGAGHVLKLFLTQPGGEPGDPPTEHDFTVRAVLANGLLAGPQATVFLPLRVLQELRGVSGEINEILVVNRCHSDIAACSGQAALDLRRVLVDRGVAETVREALADSSGRSVLMGLQARRTGRGKQQIRDLQRTAERGTVTDHLIYLLGAPEVAGTLRATASFLPSKDGGRIGRMLRDLNRLTVVEVKRGALDQANDYGSILTSSFLVLGLFSIAASLLLVFLVFVMLAAERRGEMGISRAIGLHRSHLVQSFSFEGLVYDLAAAILGVGAGITISGLIVNLVARALNGYGIPVQRHIEPRSIVIAFCLGVLVTFATVVFSAWRVSRLNLVEAIRGIAAEPELGDGMLATLRARLQSAGAGLGALTVGRVRQAAGQLVHAAVGLLVMAIMLAVRGILPVALGLVLLFQGRQHVQYLPFSLGVTLALVGGGLMLRWLLMLARVPGSSAERIAYTVAGAGLTAFWVLPPPFWHTRHGRLVVSSIETFALAGVIMVLGVVWIVAYNLAAPLQLVLRLCRRGGALTAAVKMAVAYPLQHRFRTGMAVAMFSLVIFTMVLSAALLASAHDAYVRRERPPTGYDITATAPERAQLLDMSAAIASAPASTPEEFAGIGSEASFSADIVDLSGSGSGWRNVSVRLADEGLLRSTRPLLSGRARGYDSDAAVWDAMLTRPGAAVIARGSLPFSSTSSSAPTTGLRAGDKSFSAATVWLRDAEGAPVKLTVVGIVNDATVLPSGLLTLRANVSTVGARKAVPTSFLFKTREGRDPSQAALGLDLSFGMRGLQTEVPGEVLRNVQTVRRLLNYLFEGFIGLGLISGMAALAVISTRAVVERRQEIGMLRAIGLQRRLVQLSFLLEVSFIALLGIGVGVALGLLLAHNVVVFLTNDIRDLRLTIPWREIALIAVIAYAASLATTLFAAWQAGHIDPAEALRYEQRGPRVNLPAFDASDGSATLWPLGLLGEVGRSCGSN